MKDQIAAKLNGISNLEDRKFLKNVLNDVFLNLYEHSDTMYTQLEERVFSEMEGLSNHYDIYTTITPREEIDPVHSFLRPLWDEDLTEKQYDLAHITQEAIGLHQYPLMKVFFCCDYRCLQPIITGAQTFHGAIVTEQGSIDATFILRQERNYLGQLKKLYETFLNNNIPWKTVNNPYIFRFAEVVLQKCERPPAPGEIVKEIKVDFAEYAQYVRYDMVPLWNVETLEMKSSGFPMPCQDKINFEHRIPLEDSGLEHGYLAFFEGEASKYIRRTKETLSIIAPTQEQNTWDIMRVIHPATSKNENHQYPLVSNGKRQEFIDILAQRSQRAIRTEAELKRLIDSFVSAEGLSLARIEVAPSRNAEVTESASYEMNFFIIDEIRRADYQNRLLLYFTTTDGDNFLICDQMSFIVSEVQMHYPEYKCEGIIL